MSALTDRTLPKREKLRVDPIKIARFQRALVFTTAAFLVASTLDTNYLKILFTLFMVFSHAVNNRGIFKQPVVVCLSVLFLFGVFNTLLYMVVFNIDPRLYDWIFNRTVFIGIHFIFAIGIFLYLFNKTYDFILQFIFIGAAMNLVAGAFQLVFVERELLGGRLSMLSYEPSMAASFYCFSFFIILWNKSSNKLLNISAKAYLLLGMLIRSKAQIFALVFTVTFLASKVVAVTAMLLVVTFFSPEAFSFLLAILEPLWMRSAILEQIFFLLDDVQKLLQMGFVNFVYDNPLGESSWVIRFSAIHMGYHFIIDNLLGAGWGTFNHFFTYKLEDIGYSIIVADSFTGGEIRNEAEDIYAGLQEATPKSYLIEFVSGTGIIGVLCFVSLIRRIKIAGKNVKGIMLATWSLILVALVIETAPLLSLLIVLYCLANSSAKEVRLTRLVD